MRSDMAGVSPLCNSPVLVRGTVGVWLKSITLNIMTQEF